MVFSFNNNQEVKNVEASCKLWRLTNLLFRSSVIQVYVVCFVVTIINVSVNMIAY